MNDREMPHQAMIWVRDYKLALVLSREGFKEYLLYGNDPQMMNSGIKVDAGCLYPDTPSVRQVISKYENDNLFTDPDQQYYDVEGLEKENEELQLNIP